MAKLLILATVALVVVAIRAGEPHYEALSQDHPDSYNGNYNDPMDGLGGSYGINKRIGGLRRKNNQQSSQQQPEESSYSRQEAAPAASSSSQRYSSKKKPSNYDDQYDTYSIKKETDTYESAYEEPSYSASRPASYFSRPSIDRRNGGYGGGSSVNPFALLVAPLAGISFLAAAAALAISPAYLTITTTSFGRKKRELAAVDPQLADKITPELMQKIEELQTLEKFLSTIPKDKDYQQQIMSMYLSCSGYTEDSNVCLDRVFCEYGNPRSEISEEERDVLAIILYNIMGNNFVKESFKNRLKAAARFGRDTQQCARYNCAALIPPANNVF